MRPRAPFDFHVGLAECLGHKLLAGMLRDLTARTMLVAALYQSTHDARASCADQADIVDALEAGETQRAIELMLRHIGQVEDALGKSVSTATDALEKLRATLAPLARSAARTP